MKSVVATLRRLLLDQVVLIVLLCVAGIFIPWDVVLQHGKAFLYEVRSLTETHPVWVALGYVASFIFITGISLPGPSALLLAVLGGWLFGWWGLPLSSFSSSTGASLAFLSSRHWMQDSTLFRYAPALQRFNETHSNANWVVLLSLRMNPLVPYFIENLYFGRTQMPLWQFYLITLIGMLPLTTLYVMTGTTLAQVVTYHGLISWPVVGCLVAISTVPCVIYWGMKRFARSVDRPRRN